MIARLNRILRQFRDAGTSPLKPEAIVAARRRVGYTAWRDRLLNPVATIQIFLLQVLHGNTACAHLPHLAGLGFTYCKANRPGEASPRRSGPDPQRSWPGIPRLRSTPSPMIDRAAGLPPPAARAGSVRDEG